jgi:endonuclease/exonuclease/phosphatase family metal-dependent hydrolase
MMRRVGVVVAIAAVFLTSFASLGEASEQRATAGRVSRSAASATTKQVRIVNINLLHGTFCPAETNGCDAPSRVALLLRQLEDAKCPEVVGLQEINLNLSKILTKAVPDACDGRYKTVFGGTPKTGDTERVLTTLPVKSTKVIKLIGNFRTASRVVLTSAIGPLVVVVTHQDGDPAAGLSKIPCKNCAPPCIKAKASAFVCQTVAAADLAQTAGGPKAVRVLMGDFNFTSASPRYAGLIADGWIDSHLAAGNAECDSATGAECTAGRDDKSLPTLQDPNAKESERIDLIFVKAPKGCTPAFDDSADSDGDGVRTGLFNAAPAVDGPGGLAFPSDHTGVSADLSCTGSTK